MKKNFRRIAAILVAILAIGTLTACGNSANDVISDETKNEVESNTNNTEGTVSDETNQNETKPNDSVEEIVIGKAITIVEDGCTYYVAETDTTLEAGAEIPAPNVGDKYETPDYKYTYGFEKGGKKISEWNVKVKDKTTITSIQLVIKIIICALGKSKVDNNLPNKLLIIYVTSNIK